MEIRNNNETGEYTFSSNRKAKFQKKRKVSSNLFNIFFKSELLYYVNIDTIMRFHVFYTFCQYDEQFNVKNKI